MSPNKKNKLSHSAKRQQEEEELTQARQEVDQLREVGEQSREQAEAEEKKIPVRIDQSITMPKSAARRSEDANKNFSQLYQRGGEESGMKTIDRNDPGRKKKIVLWIIAGLVVIAGAVLGGFYFFVNQEDQFTGENISITLDTNGAVSSGADTTMTIAITNGEEVALNDVELTLQYPSDYIFGLSVPRASNEAHNAWDIGTINPGKSKSITLTGQFFGENMTSESIGVLLSYVPANFNSVFQTNETLTVTIDGSIVELDLSAPAKSISDKEDRYSLTITNTSSDALEHIRVSLAIPEELTVENFSPDPTNAIRYEWEFDMLEGGESTEISWRGTLSADEGTTAELIATAGYVDTAGQFVQQAEATALLFVVNPQLLVTLKQNGSSSGSPIMFGETLAYTIVLENESQSSIKNILLSATVTGEVLDWTGLADPQSGERSGSTLQWDTTSAPVLEELAPGDIAELTFNIPVVDAITATSADDGNYTVVASATARSREVTDLEGGELSVTSEEITTAVTSKLSLRAEGRYYNDEFLPVGTGPIPPEVGVETTYQLYWYLQNTSNEVKDVSVTAVLPEYVVWRDSSSVSAGTLAYDVVTHSVTWTINKLPKHVGKFVPEVSAYFAVSVTPGTGDLGSVLTVLEKSIATATDSFTQRLISVTSDELTSALPTDPLATGTGAVVPKTVTDTNTNTSTTNTNSATNSNTNSP